MRGFARIGCTLAGLALCAPAVALAGVPQQQQDQQAKVKKKGPVAKAVAKLCASCQQRALLAKGMRVPSPSPLPAGQPVKGETCTGCGAPTAVVFHGKTYRSVLPADTGMAAGAMMAANGNAPGRAVVGGEPAPSMAFTGEPAPIGLATSHYGPSSPSAPMGVPGGMGMDVMAGADRPAAAKPPAGLRDSAVQMTSLASDPIAPSLGSRPHIISHLLGFADIGRERSIRRANAREEEHAMIPYGMPGNPITEVPASSVYGRQSLLGR